MNYLKLSFGIIIFCLFLPLIQLKGEGGKIAEHNHRYTRLLIQDVFIIDGNGTPTRGPLNIVVEKDKITQIAKKSQGKFDAIIKGEGRFLLPGLINNHAHIRKHTPGGYDYQFKLWLACGITTIRDVGSNRKTSLMLKADSNQGKIIAPRIFLYFVCGGKTPEAARLSVQEAKKMGCDGIKFFGNDQETMQALLKEAHRLGLRTAHHVGVEETDVWDDIKGGTTTIEHWYGIPDAAIPYGSQKFPSDYNYSNELDRFRWAGRLFKEADPEKLKEVLQAMVDANVAWDPTLTIYEVARDIVRGSNQPWFKDYLHPNLEEFFQPDLAKHGSYYVEWTTKDEIEWKNNYQLWFAALREFARRGGIICAGEDAGYMWRMFGTGLIRELELQQEAGFHPLDVIKHATGNNATVLGKDDELGRVKVGYKADLILVNGNPLTNFKLLYPIPTNIATKGGYEKGGMVKWILKDGFVYDGDILRADVKKIVIQARKSVKNK